MRRLSESVPDWSRRSFLKLTGMAAAAAAHPDVAFASKPETKLNRPLDPQQLKKTLAGPILSLPITFNEHMTINHDAIHRMIGRAIRYGIPIFDLTAGNSKYAS